jgi:hypothetical protein
METISITGRHSRIDVEVLIALSDLSRAGNPFFSPFSAK